MTDRYRAITDRISVLAASCSGNAREYEVAVNAIRAALADDRLVPQWKPIESAPRDGTRALFYRPLADKTGDEIIKIKRGIPRNNGCWEETVPSGMNDENYTNGMCKATHWMSLPKLPAGEPK